MQQTILIGNGWNPYLFREEIRSLVGYDQIIHPRILSITSDNSLQNLSKSALLDDNLKNAEILYNVPSNFTEEKLSEIIMKWAIKNLPTGSFAIRSRKIGERISLLSRKKIEKEVGASLMSQQNIVNLENPEYEVVVVLAGLEDISSREIEFDKLTPVIVWGLRTPIDNNRQFESRSPIDRPFFKPVSLEPRLARLMISLSHKPDYSPSIIIDPFCGTGGIAIEASLQGIQVLASDLDTEMTEGTIRNLEWSKGDGKFIVKHCGVEDISSIWGKNIQTSFVFDPPYGRNAWKSNDGLDLFLEALKSANYINPNGTICTMLPTVPEFINDHSSEKYLVMGKKWHDLELLIVNTGWSVVFKYPIKVHRSLARLILVCHPLH
jgi:putative methyltransferase (TIGR01177 family)|tara:strand:+ start:2210 stop:3346 length:1137 start_codon:yes stop_codon:yes gene_type:complete